MEYINISSPSAFYNVEKILEISQGQGNHKNYKVQWAPSWVSDIQLMGCEILIKQFLSQKENGFIDASENTCEGVKQEDESYNNQTEMESASGGIDIFTRQVQENGKNIHSAGLNKEILSDELSKDKDKNTSSDQNINTPVCMETNMLCDMIKIEEEDSPVHETVSMSNHESFSAHHNTIDHGMEDENETNASTYYMNKNKEQVPNGNHDNNNFHFDRCVKDVSSNSSSAGNHEWKNTNNDSTKKHLNRDIGFAHLNYSENGGDKHNKTTRQYKHVVSHDMKGVSINVKHQAKCVQKTKNPRNNSPNMIKDNVIQNQDSNVSTKDVSTFLQHPSSNLGSSTSSNGSLQHHKHKLMDVNNDNSTSTYIPNNSVAISDIGKYHGSNEWIDTNGHNKSTSAYTNYSCNPLEHTISSSSTEHISDHMNSNERDVNRNLTDNVNVLSNNRFETSVVNQHGEKSSDTGSLRLKTTTPSSEDWNPLLNDTNTSTLQLHTDPRTQGIVPMNTTFNQCPTKFNTYNGPLALQEYIQTPTMEGNEQATFCKMATSQTTNYERPTFYNMQKVTQEKHTKTAYLCKTCNITFTLQKAFQKHMKLHVKKKTYACSVCLKEFRCKDYWQRHIRLHTDERPYPCEVCGRRFRDYSNLKTHIRRAHTMERPHKCNMCIKMFATSSDLKKHIRIHTGERPYACKVCIMRFKTSSQLAGHSRRCNTRI